MKVIKMIAIWLLIIGGLNWGLQGLTGKDAVVMLLGTSAIGNGIKVLIGLAALLVGFKALTSKECHS